MAQTATETRVFSNGGLFTLPLDDFTDFPDFGTDLALWGDETGFVSEAGPQFSFGREKAQVMAWQSLYPLRTMVTSAPTTVALELMQWNPDNLALAAGGGTTTEPDPGVYLFEPDDASSIAEYAAIVRGIDGEKEVWFRFRRVTLASATEFAFVKDDAAKFGIELDVLQPDGGEKPWDMVTNDANFAGLGS